MICSSTSVIVILSILCSFYTVFYITILVGDDDDDDGDDDDDDDDDREEECDECPGQKKKHNTTGFLCFSECVAKGSRFTHLGVWRLTRVDPASAVRNPLQPFAHVRNRPSAAVVASKLPCLWEKSKKCDFFWRVEDVVMSFCVAGVALRGIPTCFKTCKKSLFWSFLCGRRNTFATFSEDVLHFLWQAQHFGHLRCHLAWQAQHFRRVVLRVFCESHCQRCAKWWQGANSVADVAFCDMSWKSTDASHETSILQSVHRKTRRKTLILTLYME